MKSNNRSMMNVNTVNDFLKGNPMLAKCVPGSGTPERIVSQVQVCLLTTPALRECTIESLTKASVLAIALGVDINVMNSAWLIPRTNKGVKEAGLQIGYGGLISIAKRSGEVAVVEAEVVYEKDKFSFIDGVVAHEPSDYFCTKNRGKALGYYCRLTLNSGHVQYTVMGMDEVEKARAAGGGKSGAWTTWPHEMGKKTVLRRALKMVNMTLEDNTLSLLQQAEETEYPTELPTQVFETKPGEDREDLVSRIASQATVDKPIQSKTEEPVAAVADTAEEETGFLFNREE